jgi:hypothetical protein
MKLFKGLLALTAMLVVGCESNDRSTSPHASGTPLALSETGIVAEYVLVDTHIDFNNGVSVDKNDFAISGTCTIDNDSSLTQKFIINGNTTSAYGTIVELGLIGTSAESAAKVHADSANRPIHGMVGNGIGVAQFLRD